MKITNKLGLPQAIIKALHNDSYNRGQCDFTVTELLKPAQQRALEIQHHDEIEEDAEDMLYRLYGQIVHGILERANEKDLAEKRFYGKFINKIVGGQIDTLSLADGTLTDYKFTTVYKAKQLNPPPEEFVQQLNIQAEILRQNDIQVNKLQIICMVRDHRIRELKQNRAAGFDDYPENPVTIMQIPMWTREKIISFVENRIMAHLAARDVHGKGLECSSKERYAESPVYAVMPAKGKRAIRLCDTEEGAKAIQALYPQSTIQYREGNQIVKCENYCSVSQWCKQYKKLKGDKNEI
jgi:hypothetical protein